MIVASMRHAAQAVLGLEIPDEELRAHVGGAGLRDQMLMLAPDRVEELVDAYRVHNEPCTTRCSVRRDARGARPPARRGPAARPRHRQAARDRPARLRPLPLEHLFEVVVASEDTERHKPDPAPVLLALDRMSARPEGAAYVGDSPFDVAAANAAGVFSIAVGGGHPPPRARRGGAPGRLRRDRRRAARAALSGRVTEVHRHPHPVALVRERAVQRQGREEQHVAAAVFGHAQRAPAGTVAPVVPAPCSRNPPLSRAGEDSEPAEPDRTVAEPGSTPSRGRRPCMRHPGAAASPGAPTAARSGRRRRGPAPPAGRRRDRALRARKSAGAARRPPGRTSTSAWSATQAGWSGRGTPGTHRASTASRTARTASGSSASRRKR